MRQTMRAIGKRALYYARNPRQLFAPERDLIRPTTFGARMLCSHENYIERTILQTGVFEETSTKTVLETVGPGQTVFDVGANVGYYTLLLAKCVGPTGQVHAFEPTAWAHERALMNLALNTDLGRTNVVANRTGLLAEPRVAFEAIESQFSAKNIAHRAREHMSFTTIDDYCTERGIDKIDFVKVDVDGYDVDVIRGARKVLLRSNAILLCEFCEWVLRPKGESIASYVAALAQLGYFEGEVLDGPLRGVQKLADLANSPTPESYGSPNVLLRRSS